MFHRWWQNAAGQGEYEGLPSKMFKLQNPSPRWRKVTERDSWKLDVDASSTSSSCPVENIRTPVAKHWDTSRGSSAGSSQVQQVVLWPLENNGTNDNRAGHLLTRVPVKTTPFTATPTNNITTGRMILRRVQTHADLDIWPFDLK